MERVKIIHVRKKNSNNTRMLNFDYVPNENIKEHNPKWRDIPDHPC